MKKVARVAAAIIVGALVLTSAAVEAQVVTGGTARDNTTIRGDWRLLSGLDASGRTVNGVLVPGNFSVTRFGIQNGQLVALGVLTPKPLSQSLSLNVRGS